MKKFVLYAVMILLGAATASAESERYKILYLIPFESADYVTPVVKECP